jgi:hypothetical protein
LWHAAAYDDYDDDEWCMARARLAANRGQRIVSSAGNDEANSGRREQGRSRQRIVAGTSTKPSFSCFLLCCANSAKFVVLAILRILRRTGWEGGTPASLPPEGGGNAHWTGGRAVDVVHERPRLDDNIQDTTRQETLLEDAVKRRARAASARRRA